MVSKWVMGSMLASSVMLAAVSVYADTTLKVQGSDGLKSTIQIRDGKGRVSSEGRGEYLLYDSGNGTITYVEPIARQYTQLTAAELGAMVKTAADIADIKESVSPYLAHMLAGLPAEQRKLIEQRIGVIPGAAAAGKPLKSANIRTVDRGKDNIAGLRCQVSDILKHGRLSAEVCMATAASGPLSSEDFATLEAMVTLSRSMAGSAGSLLGSMAEQIELLTFDLDGVPLAVRDIENNKRYQVIAVSNAALSNALFNGYGSFQKQAMPGLLR